MVKSKTTSSKTLDQLFDECDIKPLVYGDIIDGRVISVEKHEVWLDIGQYGVGVIHRRELVAGAKIELDQTLSVSVVLAETVAGHAILSLRRALKNKGWEEIQRLYETGGMVEVESYDANRGGLLIELDGVGGFLPVSQLSAEHYPRVTNRVARLDRDEILQKLHKLVGKKIKVCVLDFDRRLNKVIFSEKEALKEIIAKQIADLNVGDVVEGLVTAVIEFGAFVNINGVEGLVHISEISWERVDDPRNHLQPEQKIKVKIVAIDKNRLALSIRQLSVDPWLKESEKLVVNSKVVGKITRVTVFGAFVQISSVIEGLVHVGEVDLGDKEPRDRRHLNPEDIFKVGDSHEFTIINIDRNNRKVSLSYEEVKK